MNNNIDVIIEDIDEDIIKKNMKKRNKKRKKNRLKKINIYFLILSIILIIVEILNIFLVVKYGVLPIKYLIILIIFMIIIPILLIYFMFKKKGKKWLKVFISIITMLFITLFLFSFIYLNKTFNFIDNFTNGFKHETKIFYVVVLNNSNINELKELNDKKVSYINYNNDSLLTAYKKLQDSVVITRDECDDYDILFNKLIDQMTDAILINSTYYTSYLEENVDVKDQFKILHEISLLEEVIDIKKDVDVQNDTFNIYLSGIDSYGSVNSLTRSDVNIVISVNPKTNQILMINIPRDYYVTFHGTNTKDKLTHAGIYGIDMSVQTIEDLLDIEINYYFKVNYAALVNLVNALDGVDVYSKYNFTSTGKFYKFTKGYNHVNGDQALEFVRTRKVFADGDRVRGENQQAMIQAIIKKACSAENLSFNKYSNILDSLNGFFATNLSTDKITSLINLQLDKMPNWNITSISLNGSDGSEYTYSYPHQKLYVMIPDMNTVNNAVEILDKVDNGEILNSSYIEEITNVNIPTVNKPKEKDKIVENKTENESINQVDENNNINQENLNETVENDTQSEENDEN